MYRCQWKGGPKRWGKTPKSRKDTLKGKERKCKCQTTLLFFGRRKISTSVRFRTTAGRAVGSDPEFSALLADGPSKFDGLDGDDEGI
jgi:hypothetical protein